MLFGAQTHCGPSEKANADREDKENTVYHINLVFHSFFSKAGTNNPGLIIIGLARDSSLEMNPADSSHGAGPDPSAVVK